MHKLKIAKIYVDKTTFHFDKAFDYTVPQELSETITKGSRVIVPFGKSNRKTQGIVYEVVIVDEIINKLKPILYLLDEEPILSDEMVKIAEFMVKNTFCTFYEAVKTILPTGLGVDIKESYVLSTNLDKIDLSDLTEHENNLLEFLRLTTSQKEANEIINYSKSSGKKAVIASLINKGVIVLTEELKNKSSEKFTTMFRLSENFYTLEGEVKFTVKQKEVINFLQSVNNATKKEIEYYCAAKETVVKNLIKKGYIECFDVPIVEDLEEENRELESLELSENQNEAFTELLGKLGSNEASVSLLHGVTASGKTSVFIKLIEATVNKGKQALVLVPEIALTPQMVRKFKLLFPNKVATIHSNLSISERVAEYKKIKDNKVSIVVGTRSAIFAPFDNIGIIVMDEEGEYSYKSDANPRYHAREIAKFRCVYHKALLLLASATPSVESYYKAQKGVYSLINLTQRYSGHDLPEVYIIDMNEELKNGNSSTISFLLKQEIEKNIIAGEQSIILLNRRGYNTIMKCTDCGEVLKCVNCDVAMTFHKANGYMMCHHCGHSVAKPENCAVCGCEHQKLMGFGTQKIQDDINALFPNARVLRMDTDTTGSKFAYDSKFRAFANKEYDILIGTQMIAKGLDFEDVTLVGVLNVDAGLYSDDYKASERVFSLVTQVVGRSGRSEKKGRAYIQTQIPDNPVINFAAEQNYNAFYEDEIISRKALKYPPFCDICVIGISATKQEHAKKAANTFVNLIKLNAKNANNKLKLSLLGPFEASIYRLNNKYREKIILKCIFNNAFKEYLKSVTAMAGKHPDFRNITLTVDINSDIN